MVQNLVNLTEVNLSNCEHLTTIPDLSKAKNLERLNLQFCTTLKAVPSSIQFLEKLVDLDLRSCTSLLSLPRIIKSKYLKALNLSGCSNLKMYPETTEHVMYLNFNETAIKELPQSIGHLSRLVALNLRDCKQLGNLPDSICLLKSIVIVDVSGCSNVTKFPSIPGNTRYLYLSGTAVEEFPFSKLNLSGCSNITEFPNVSCNIKELYLDGTTIEEIPSSIGCFYKLVELHLQNCTKFKILPGSICKLKSLQKLNLSGCSQFQRFLGILETMESLRYLYLDRTGIEKLPSPIRNLKGLCFLELGNCIYLEGKYLASSQNLLNFSEILLRFYFASRVILGQHGILEVPKSLGCLTSLEALDLSGNNFVRLPKNISELSELQYLGLCHCWRLAKLDARSCTSLRTVPSSSTILDGNIFEFIFTNCLKLDETISSVAAGVSSFCFPGCKVPAWFVQQNSAASVTIQLPSHCPSSELLGFMLCTVVAFEPSYDDSGGFQVK
ncbi:hypothetical protein NC652_041211 [Populus alba x Populus x berolinensis]|nr:hypothetical protein NC652_041211 [Populus alba x Populus x berolinensis]